jgi:hypothetical protein
VAKSKLGYKLRRLPNNFKVDDLHDSVKLLWHDPQCNYKSENLKQVCGAELDALRD